MSVNEQTIQDMCKQIAETNAMIGGYDCDTRATKYYLLAQTPKYVWSEYLKNGYTIWEAVREEMSYDR